MTRDETKQLLFAINSLYVNFTIKSSEDLTNKTNIWFFVLEEFELADIMQAFKIYATCDNKGFPPTAGQLIDKIYTVENLNELTEFEAWAMVSKAISRSGYHSIDEFSRLPEIIQRAAGRSENLKNWSQLACDEVETVIQSNFIRNYRLELQKKSTFERLPKDIKESNAFRISEPLKESIPKLVIIPGSISDCKEADTTYKADMVNELRKKFSVN